MKGLFGTDPLHLTETADLNHFIRWYRRAPSVEQESVLVQSVCWGSGTHPVSFSIRNWD